MKTYARFRVILVVIGLVGASLSASTASAVVPPSTAASTPAAEVEKLVTALEKRDYDGFVANGDTAFVAFKKEQFEAVASQLGLRLQKGREIRPLGELKKRGQQVTLWKITLKDGSDDLLATSSMKDGKVTGFWVN